MAKWATSKKQRNSEKKPIAGHGPFENSKAVRATLLECIGTGDIDAFRETLASFITNSNKLRFSQKTGLGRKTLYDILDPNKGFNPALSTVTAILRGLAE